MKTKHPTFGYACGRCGLAFWRLDGVRECPRCASDRLTAFGDWPTDLHRAAIVVAGTPFGRKLWCTIHRRWLPTRQHLGRLTADQRDAMLAGELRRMSAKLEAR